VFAWRNRPRGLLRRLLGRVGVHLAHLCALRGRRVRDARLRLPGRVVRDRTRVFLVFVDQLLLPLVPLLQQLLARRTTRESGMDLPLVADIGDVPGRDGVAVDLPDRLRGVREVVGQKAPAVLL